MIDYQALLPHFTVKLSMELCGRLQERIIEPGGPVKRGIAIDPKNPAVPIVREFPLDSKDAYEFAHQIVRRMYRTQLKEARAVQSFAQAWLDYQQPQIEEKIKLLPDGPANKLKTMFSKKEEV